MMSLGHIILIAATVVRKANECNTISNRLDAFPGKEDAVSWRERKVRMRTLPQTETQLLGNDKIWDLIGRGVLYSCIVITYVTLGSVSAK